jgi:sec-independent protein translocase protein TatA
VYGIKICDRFEDKPSKEVVTMSFGSLGLPEILLILLIVVIIFGARRLPELGKSLGEGIKNFKKSVSGKEPSQKEISSDKTESPKKEE